MPAFAGVFLPRRFGKDNFFAGKCRLLLEQAMIRLKYKRAPLRANIKMG